MKGESCCSMECRGKYISEIYLGKNNPNYGNKGSLNPMWKSDEKISYYGYRLIRDIDHPFANCDGFVFKHRLVAEKYLLTNENSVEIDGKRYLSPEFDVHHKDRNRLNNDPDNLMILTKSEHLKLHSRERKLAS